MCPAFGVPWPRLDRAAKRLQQLHAPQRKLSCIQPMLFLCGLRYLTTYRAVTRRRLTHYVDDGLREAVDASIPALMAGARELNVDSPVGRFRHLQPNVEYQQIIHGFLFFEEHLPPSVLKWLTSANYENNLVRLTFGMGVVSRFSPVSHALVRRMVMKPLQLSPELIDVLESFRWDAAWSVALSP